MRGAQIRGAVPRLQRLARTPGGRHVVVLVLDSLRFDAWAPAGLRAFSGFGPVECRFAWATWTAPSHYNLLMGLLPHQAPTGVFAATHHQQLLKDWGERLGVEDFGFLGMLPRLWLPDHLRDHLGYETRAFVSMPVLNGATPLAVGFDRWESMPRHNDLSAVLDRLDFPVERPSFTLINTGETHYPYAGAAEDPSRWPKIPGLHGAVARLGAGLPLSAEELPQFFSPSVLAEFRERQVAALAGLDHVFCRLLERLPSGSRLVVTSDHGELFGEEGWFGHGPIPHRKVLEVPYLECQVP